MEKVAEQIEMNFEPVQPGETSPPDKEELEQALANYDRLDDQWDKLNPGRDQREMAELRAQMESILKEIGITTRIELGKRAKEF